MPPDEPHDPISRLSTDAAHLHELFLSLVAAGFDKWEALYLLGVSLSGGRSGA